MLSGTGPCPVEVYKTFLLMDEREMGSQPPVIILDHFSFTLTFVSWVDRGSFPTKIDYFALFFSQTELPKHVVAPGGGRPIDGLREIHFILSLGFM